MCRPKTRVDERFVAAFLAILRSVYVCIPVGVL